MKASQKIPGKFQNNLILFVIADYVNQNNIMTLPYKGHAPVVNIEKCNCLETN